MGRIRFISRALFWVAAWLLLACPLWAQYDSGIEGTVNDPSGAAIPNAQVTIVNIATGVTQTAQANNVGYFSFPTLAPGRYKVTGNAPGFETVVVDNVVLEPSHIQGVSLKMLVGRAQTTVTVSAPAPEVQTTEPKVSGLTGQQEIQDLPLLGLNVLNLADLSPGVTGWGMMGSSAISTMTANQFGGLDAMGQPNSANLYFIDGTAVSDFPSGGDAIILPNASAVAEFVTTVTNYSAEFGRGSGLQVQMVTRSGTDQLHGSAYDYYSSSAMTARNIFQNTVNPLTGQILAPYHKNEFGGSLGGPIWKDRTFFFVTWDEIKSSTGNTYLSTVETPAFVSFMQQNYPNNIATTLLANYHANVAGLTNFQTVADLLPTPTSVATPYPACTGTTGPLGMPCDMQIVATGTTTYSALDNGFNGNLRIDQYFGKDRIFGNYIRVRETTTSENTRPTWNFNVPNNGWYGGLDWTHTFTPSVINEMSFGGAYDRAFFPCEVCHVPVINITGLDGFGEGFAPTVFGQAEFHWKDIVYLTRGKQSLKAGFEIAHNQDFAPFTQDYVRPTFQFNDIFDFANDKPATESGVDIDPRTGTFGNVDRYWVDSYYSGFVQDDWKVKPNLTLNLGLRWDFYPSPYEKHGNRGDLELGSGSNFLEEIANAYVVQEKYAFLHTHKRYFTPRFGFAWQPSMLPNWVVRGGFGVFMNRGDNTIWSDSAFSNPPIIATITDSIFVPSGPQPLYALCASDTYSFGCPLPPFPVGLNARGGPIAGAPDIGGPDLSLKQAYAENMFLGVQRSFGKNWVVEADFLGSRGIHLYSEINRNRVAGEQNAADNYAIIRPNPYFGAINYSDNSNFSKYAGGAFSVRKRFGNGLTFATNFTVGLTQDFMSGAPGCNKCAETAPVFNAWDLQAQWGRSNQDIPKQLTFNVVYQLPKARSLGSVGRMILGGWNVSSLANLSSGLPQTVFTSIGDYLGDGYFYDAPNAPAFGNHKSGLSRTDYLNGVFTASQFPSPCPTPEPCGVEGNLGRNTFLTPGFAQIDGALMKSGRIPWFVKEGAQLEFRGEFFNLFNRVNLTGWDTNMADGTFGKATGVRIPRTPQVSMRIIF